MNDIAPPETLPATDAISTTRRIAVVASYVCTATDVIELPEGRSWADVASHGLLWDRWFVAYHDGTEAEFPFDGEIDAGEIDFKRPDYQLFEADEDGVPVWDAFLGDQ